MDRTITLRSDLVERLETLARTQGRTVDEVVDTLLKEDKPMSSGANWALALAEAMETADIDWQDEPDISANSRHRFRQHTYEDWLHSQQVNPDDDA